MYDLPSIGMALLQELQLYCSFSSDPAICLIWWCQCKIRGILGFTNNLTELPERIGHRQITLQIKRVEPLEVWCFFFFLLKKKKNFEKIIWGAAWLYHKRAGHNTLWVSSSPKYPVSPRFLMGLYLCIYLYNHNKHRLPSSHHFVCTIKLQHSYQLRSSSYWASSKFLNAILKIDFSFFPSFALSFLLKLKIPCRQGWMRS